MKATILLAFVLAGCGPAPLARRTDAHGLSQGTLGVLVMVPSKRLLVLDIGLSDRARAFSFEGIWDPCPVVRTALIRELQTRFRLAPKTFEGSLAEGEAEPFRAARERAFSERIRTSTVAHALRNPTEDDLRALRRGASEYSLEVWVTLGVVNRAFVLHAYARLMREGVVLWSAAAKGASALPDVETTADLAKGDLAILKRALAAAAENLVGGELFDGFVPR